MNKLIDENIDKLITDAFEKGDQDIFFDVWENYAGNLTEKISQRTDYPDKVEIQEFIFDRLMLKLQTKPKIYKNPKGFLGRLIFNEFKNFFRIKQQGKRHLDKYIEICRLFPKESKKDIYKKVLWELIIEIINTELDAECSLAIKASTKQIKKRQELLKQNNISQRRYYYLFDLGVKQIKQKLGDYAQKKEEIKKIIYEVFGDEGLSRLAK